MKTRVCYQCKKRKPIEKFGRNKMYLNCGARDGINIYCKKCRTNDMAARRARSRQNKPRVEIKRKEMRLATLTTIKERTLVLQAIQTGLHSRESIRRHTKLNMDQVVDVLADLAFETGQLRIVRIGEAREFHLAA